MDEEVKQKYVEAGEVVQEARKRARKLAVPGRNLGEIAEGIEGLIREKGLEPAFPVNISVNEQAAHYTPSGEEERELKASDVVKIDIGAHLDGYIADSALTVNPSGNQEDMIEVNEEVLDKALEFIEPGVTVGEIGTFIHNQVPEKYSVVRNLTGHSLGRYQQHAGLSIPNISNSNNTVLEEGDAVAIEPFLSTASGKVKEGKKGNIYISQDGNPRGRAARELIKRIESFNGMPFTSRWLELSGREKMALKKMVNSGAVKHYPVLKEKKGVVTQTEHTVLVGADEGENIVTTR